MKYRAVIKQSDGWWIGWLVDLPGVNAQERTKPKLIESLQIGAQDMLVTQVPFEPETRMALIEVPDTVWDSGLGLMPQAA
jgi:predicted RNase H-like HicB family nuclease